MSELYVILARPQKALNIGSVVRLANNFGVTGVRTSGIEDFDRHKACITAPNLEKEVSAVQCFESFDDAIKDINLKFGFTARHRKYQGTDKICDAERSCGNRFQHA